MHSLFKRQTVFKKIFFKIRINYRRIYKDNITSMQTTAQTQQLKEKENSNLYITMPPKENFLLKIKKITKKNSPFPNTSVNVRRAQRGQRKPAQQCEKPKCNKKIDLSLL